MRGLQQFEESDKKWRSAYAQSSSPAIHDLDVIKQKIQAASGGLLVWPTTLGDNQQIPRCELEELKARIFNEENSTILILGAPGTGKSALLATLGNTLLTDQIALLAIKADQLRRSINTLADLQRGIQIDPITSLIDAIKALASREKVVVLIDQLDAVSELLDRESERLNVLLNLIQSLSNIKNVHVIATSREFEFRHDVRLSCINAERLDLRLPSWNDIAPILTVAKHNPDSMGKPLRDLLLTPLHLKLFLDVAVSNDVFESLHALLERLWQQQVVDSEGLPRRLELLQLMADRMADLEELWLPASIADQYPLERQALEQAQILTRGQNELTLGFRHQTYYDYTWARRFAREPGTLVEYVLSRQDGLFVRPALLSSLNYLRNTSPTQYHQELRQFLGAELRLHIRTLILEFIAGQENPSDAEANLLLPLLTCEVDGPRVLAAVAGRAGWFARLRYHPNLERWLEKPVQQAAYCTPLLTAAASFAGDAVIELVEDYWLNEASYDSLSFRVFLNIESWNASRIALLIPLIRRFPVDRWNLSALMERIVDNQPDLVPQVLRAHLDLQLEQVLEAANQAESKLPPDATEQQGYRYELGENPRILITNLVKDNQDLEAISSYAQAAPKAFLDHLWDWFLHVIERTAKDGNPYVISYRETSIRLRELDEEDKIYNRTTIAEALGVAITELAMQRRKAFWNFVSENIDSDLCIVHRLIAQGLQQIVAQEPSQILNYLLGDQRRFSLGDYPDQHRDSKRLISAIYPHLTPEQKEQLEKTVIGFSRYIQIPPTVPVNERLQWIKWNRQDRLRLLRAFPEDGLGSTLRLLRQEEERALPNTEDRSGGIWGGSIGGRITADEMALASDREILKLFDALPDATEWHLLGMTHDLEPARAGGARELAHEFFKFAQAHPARANRLIEQLHPRRHEVYAGKGLQGLAQSEFPTARLIDLIDRLNQRSFTSQYFREDAAYALEKVAERDRWLPEASLRMLEEWLDNHQEPILPSEVQTEQKLRESRRESILFRDGHWLPLGGRSTILAAIATGYLKQQPPDLNNWVRVIQHRLHHEQHPGIWAETIIRMPVLFQGDVIRATQVYGSVFQAHPEILQNSLVLHSIARIIGWFQPKEKLQEWLNQLRFEGLEFCHQAYGEMLFLYYWCCGDTWSQELIDKFLAKQTNEDVLLGLAYGASKFWYKSDCRAISTKILCTLASHSSQNIQTAVADVFRLNWKNFQLNLKMKLIIQAVCNNPPVLLEAAGYLMEMLEPLTGQEPALVSQVCQTLLQTCSSEVGEPTQRLYPLAEILTSVSLTLHRQSEFREAGLQIFEQLLTLNLREARVALEILDRKPIQLVYSVPRRRRWRRQIS